jgi:hypothetical protein
MIILNFFNFSFCTALNFRCLQVLSEILIHSIFSLFFLGKASRPPSDSLFFFGENYEYKLSDILILGSKRSLEENKTEKKKEEREKGRKTKTAGYSGAFSGITSHPTEFGVSCSVAQLCRLIRRTFLFKKLNQ